MEKRSTPQERWAGNTPQRKLVESIFAGSVWQEHLADEIESAEVGEPTELDALLRAITGFYHMVKVHGSLNHDDLLELDRMLNALTDPVTAGRGELIGMNALKRASGIDTEIISDMLSEMASLVRTNCSSPPAGADLNSLSLSSVTDCLHGEIAEMSAVVEYRPNHRLHTLAAKIAALYCDGDIPERVHLVQQHLSLDARAPLHMVDSLPLRGALYGFGRHHDQWAAQRAGGLDTPEAMLVHVLTGQHGYRAESLRETLACMSPSQIDEIEETLASYLSSFVEEYGAGAELSEEELDWSLLPELLSRLAVDGSDNLSIWVRGAAGNERATRDLLEQLREWHLRAPARYHSPAAAALLDAVLDGGEINADEFDEAIGKLVTLFTTPVETVRDASEPTPRTAAVDAFLARLDDVQAGRAEPDGEVMVAHEEAAEADAAPPRVRHARTVARPAMVAVVAPPVPATPRYVRATQIVPAAVPALAEAPVVERVVAEPLPVRPDLLPRERPEAAIVAEGRFGKLTAAQIVEGLAVIADARAEDVDAIIAHFTSNGVENSRVAVTRIRDTLRRELEAYRHSLNEKADNRGFMTIYSVLQGLMGTTTEPHARPLSEVINHHGAIPGPQRAGAQRAAINMLYAALEHSLASHAPKRDTVLKQIGAVVPQPVG